MTQWRKHHTSLITIKTINSSWLSFALYSSSSLSCFPSSGSSWNPNSVSPNTEGMPKHLKTKAKPPSNLNKIKKTTETTGWLNSELASNPSTILLTITHKKSKTTFPHQFRPFSPTQSTSLSSVPSSMPWQSSFKPSSDSTGTNLDSFQSLSLSLHHFWVTLSECNGTPCTFSISSLESLYWPMCSKLFSITSSSSVFWVVLQAVSFLSSTLFPWILTSQSFTKKKSLLKLAKTF